MNNKVFFIAIILMFVDIIKTMFNKNELMNFIIMMGINITMFGVILGFTGVMSQYIGEFLMKVKEDYLYSTNYDNIKLKKH